MFIITPQIKYGPCPCKKGKMAKYCCLVNETWVCSGMVLGVSEPPSGESVKGCYLKDFSDCKKPISSEHYFSRNILEFIESISLDSKIYFDVKHLPLEVTKKIRIETAGSNILCKHHNQSLSGLDSEAGNFFRYIYRFGNDWSLCNDVVLINGENIQLWALKFVCGVIASRASVNKKGERRKSSDIPKQFLDILLGLTPWPEDWGLYQLSAMGIDFNVDAELPTALFSDQSTEKVYGFRFSFAGLEFFLNLGAQAKLLEKMIFHPEQITFQKGGFRKSIILGWENPTKNGSPIVCNWKAYWIKQPECIEEILSRSRSQSFKLNEF